MIKIAFVSNYFNHHQSSFSDAMAHRPETDYHFIETMPMEAERKSMGWGGDDRPAYVLPAYESEATRARCEAIVREADFIVVGSGSAPDAWLAERHRAGSFIFRATERLYKDGCPRWQIPLRSVKNHFRFNRWPNDYLLCASAFTAADAAITRSYLGKAYRWGYFPVVKEQNLDALVARKRSNPVLSLLWAGRFLDWKHPDAALAAAEALKAKGIPFHLDIIGTGEMEDTLRLMIQEKGLSDCVTMLGSMTPEQVRDHMERADIYLFTSDRGEGWGAVLNESMNSACAVVASHAIGSVPFLIRDGENGFIYQDGDLGHLSQLVLRLAEDRALRERLGAAAYQTMASEWNADIAAERLVALYEDLRAHGSSSRFQEGPCSPAPILSDDWYQK